MYFKRWARGIVECERTKGKKEKLLKSRGGKGRKKGLPL